LDVEQKSYLKRIQPLRNFLSVKFLLMQKFIELDFIVLELLISFDVEFPKHFFSKRNALQLISCLMKATT